MSESSSKSSQPLASKQEKDGTEKRGRGRPRKQPPVSPGTALVGSQVGEQSLAFVSFLGLGRHLHPAGCDPSWEGAECVFCVRAFPVCVLTAFKNCLRNSVWSVTTWQPTQKSGGRCGAQLFTGLLLYTVLNT